MSDVPPLVTLLLDYISSIPDYFSCWIPVYPPASGALSSCYDNCSIRSFDARETDVAMLWALLARRDLATTLPVTVPLTDSVTSEL